MGVGGSDEGQGRPEVSPQWPLPYSFSSLNPSKDSVSVILQVPLANFWTPCPPIPLPCL